MRITSETKRKIITWTVLSLLSALSILLCYFLGHWNLSDCFLVPGVGYLALAGMIFVSRRGVFDIFNYQFRNFVDSFRKGSPKRYENAGDYKIEKKRYRDGNPFDYLPYLLLGSIYLILCIVFAFVL